MPDPLAVELDCLRDVDQEVAHLLELLEDVQVEYRLEVGVTLGLDVLELSFTALGPEVIDGPLVDFGILDLLDAGSILKVVDHVLIGLGEKPCHLAELVDVLRSELSAIGPHIQKRTADGFSAVSKGLQLAGNPDL